MYFVCYRCSYFVVRSCRDVIFFVLFALLVGDVVNCFVCCRCSCVCVVLFGFSLC